VPSTSSAFLFPLLAVLEEDAVCRMGVALGTCNTDGPGSLVDRREVRRAKGSDAGRGPDTAVGLEGDEGPALALACMLVEEETPFLGGDGVDRRSDAFPFPVFLLPSAAFFELVAAIGVGAPSFPSMVE
jgi:hypothetical protein